MAASSTASGHTNMSATAGTHAAFSCQADDGRADLVMNEAS